VFYDDTWQWTGSNWNELIANEVLSPSGAAAAGPSPRTAATMSGNAANDTVVLFGGQSVQGVLADTWVWSDVVVQRDNNNNPTRWSGTWLPTNPTQSPPARSQAAMAYAVGTTADPKFGGPILFGGNGASGALQDTWSWDGVGWARATPAGQPAARRGPVAAQGPNNTMVMNGGTGSGGALSDTWTWSGAIDAAPLPTPTITTCPTTAVALPTTVDNNTLRGAAAATHPNLLVGVAVTAKEIYAADAEQQITAGSQFNMMASSNQMWWSAVENEPYTFDFCAGDTFAAYAAAYHQTMRYHNLIAGTAALGQTPNWVQSPVLPWTATSLSAVMKQWITTVIDRYRGKVSVFDTVNEALDPVGDPSVNVFQQVIGYPKYVEEAFQYANAANPQALLLYDDYLNWYGAKYTNEKTLLGDLQSTTHVDVAGMEMFGVGPELLPGSGDPRSADLTTAMSTLASTYGVKTGLTQMNVPFFETYNTSGTSDPLIPASWQLTNQQKVYDYLTKACLASTSNCAIFMIWGVSDTYALAVSPTKAKLDTTKDQLSYPYGGTLFDPEYQPRPAFGDVLGLLQQ
jgi:endo-1,4-beta-xylanase